MGNTNCCNGQESDSDTKEKLRGARFETVVNEGDLPAYGSQGTTDQTLLEFGTMENRNNFQIDLQEGDTDIKSGNLTGVKGDVFVNAAGATTSITMGKGARERMEKMVQERSGVPAPSTAEENAPLNPPEDEETETKRISTITGAQISKVELRNDLAVYLDQEKTQKVGLDSKSIDVSEGAHLEVNIKESSSSGGGRTTGVRTDEIDAKGKVSISLGSGAPKQRPVKSIDSENVGETQMMETQEEKNEFSHIPDERPGKGDQSDGIVGMEVTEKAKFSDLSVSVQQGNTNQTQTGARFQKGLHVGNLDVRVKAGSGGNQFGTVTVTGLQIGGGGNETGGITGLRVGGDGDCVFSAGSVFVMVGGQGQDKSRMDEDPFGFER